MPTEVLVLGNAEMRDPTKRVRQLAAGLGLIAALVIVRAAQLQLLNHSEIETLSRRQFHTRMLIKPSRGTILGRNGETLATSEDSFSLAANPAKTQNRRYVARLLGRALDLPSTKIHERLKQDREFVWIKRQLSPQNLAMLRRLRLVDSSGDWIVGLWLVKESRRTYPLGEIGKNVIGNVNIDGEGIEGVELAFDEKLKGRVTSVAATRDALGRPAYIDAAELRAKDGLKDGETVVTTLEPNLQFEVEQILAGSLASTQARSGIAVVMDARNGDILANAVLPLQPLRNRTVTDAFEPGSTIKPLIAALGLSQGWKLSDQVWGGRGEFIVQGKKISEAEAHEKFEWISVKDTLRLSSNVGAAKFAMRLGAERLVHGLRDLGFAAKTSSGFPGEVAGRFQPFAQWTPLVVANVGFGQGLMTTPIQMLRAYGALANGGLLVTPRWTLGPSAMPSVGPGGAASKRVLSSQTVLDVTRALESVVADGTGTKAAIPGYTVVGKTGTAQAVDSTTGKYSKTRYIPSFAGYLYRHETKDNIGSRRGSDIKTQDNEPKLVAFVMLDEPKGIYYGSETAAPLFRKVMEAAIRRFHLRPDTPVSRAVLAKSTSPPASLDTANNRTLPSIESALPLLNPKLELVELDQTWKMPVLKGLTAREALRALSGHPFEIRLKGTGVVVDQSPAAGQSLRSGQAVRLIFSSADRSG